MRRRRVTLVAGLLLCAATAGVARAQTAVALSFAQPLLPAAVAQVQERLRDQGAYGGAVDGAWGPDSAAALAQFQQTRGLQVTGQMNRATAVLLGLDSAQLLGLSAPAAAAPLAPAPAVPVLPSSPPPVAAANPAGASVLGPVSVRNLQTRLRELGYYAGAIDGQWGPQAETALRRFQQANGVEASGRINRQTVAAMGLNPDDPSAPARP